MIKIDAIVLVEKYFFAQLLYFYKYARANPFDAPLFVKLNCSQ